MTVPLSTRRDRVRREVQHLSSAGVEGDALHRQAVELLGSVVGFEGYCSIDMDPASGLIARVVATDDVSRGRHYFEHLYFEYDADSMRRLGHRRPAAHAFSESTTVPSERQAYMVSRGIAHQLRVGLVSGRDLWGALLLFRGPQSSAFSREELELLSRVGPHLGSGLRAANLRQQTGGDDRPDIPGVLVIDRRGRIVQYTSAAEGWLREMVDLPAGWREGDGLPTALWLALGTLRVATGRTDDGTTHIDIRTRTGRWLRLRAMSTEGARRGEVMIVFEPLQPRDLVWLRTATYSLTAREGEVVDLVMRGASTGSIAATLCIAPYTVQDHLSHVFDKVGVRNRRALVKQLYLDGSL